MPIERREYRGLKDLRLMQDLIQREWDLTSRHHIGDLAWGRASREADFKDWPTALWMEGGACLGWGWINMPETLDLMVSCRCPDLATNILNWFEKTATSSHLNVEILEHETVISNALRSSGYALAEGKPFSVHTVRDLDNLPNVVLPEGFRAKPFGEGIDVELRAQAHALAWGLLPFREDGNEKNVAVTSQITPARYQAVKDAWPWRANLDWIILAPDGTPAACCIMWYDEANGVGELEPVGTHPDYRRRGLGAAVCLAAMHAVKAAGASKAVVYPRGDAAYPVPEKLYSKLGFKPYGRTQTWIKTR